MADESGKPEPADLPEHVLRIAKALYENYGADRVILFGSTARGDTREWSDVDILVIKNGETDHIWERIGRARLAIMEVKKGIPVDVLVNTDAEVEAEIRRGNYFYQDIMEEGIVIERELALLR